MMAGLTSRVCRVERTQIRVEDELNYYTVAVQEY